MKVWKSRLSDVSDELRRVRFYTEINGKTYKYGVDDDHWREVVFLRGGMDVALLEASSPLEFLIVVGDPITTTISKVVNRTQFMELADKRIDRNDH